MYQNGRQRTGLFRKQFWPKEPNDSWKAFACRIKRAFILGVLLHKCVYCWPSLFSLTPPPILQLLVPCFFSRWWRVDGGPRGNQTSPWGRGWRLSWEKEATQNYSICVSYKNLERKAACCSLLHNTPAVNVVKYLAEQILPKQQNCHYQSNFNSIHCFFFWDIFAALGTRHVWAWLNYHQVRLSFFFFVFFFK